MRKLKLDELGRLDEGQYAESEKFPLTVVLDNVRSKANVGSVFRNSDAYRVERILLGGYTPTPPERTIAKTALGAEATVAWDHEWDILPELKRLREDGYHLLAIEQVEESTNLAGYKLKAGEKYAVIFGNEVEGVRDEVIQLCEACLEIPMYGTKHSFNVAVSSGIVLYALGQQWGAGQGE